MTGNGNKRRINGTSSGQGEREEPDQPNSSRRVCQGYALDTIQALASPPNIPWYETPGRHRKQGINQSIRAMFRFRGAREKVAMASVKCLRISRDITEGSS